MYFQYIDALIVEDRSDEADVSTRQEMAKSVLTELEHIWRSRAVTACTKLCLLRSLVWLVATQGAEALSFGKREQQRLLSFETVCYRPVI